MATEEKDLITPRRWEFLQRLMELEKVRELTDPEGARAGPLKVKAADLQRAMERTCGWPSSSFYSMLYKLEGWGIAGIYEDLVRRRHKKGRSQRRKSKPTLYVWFKSDARERFEELSERIATKGPGGPPDLERALRRAAFKRSRREQAEWPERVSRDIGRILEEAAVLHGLEWTEGIPISAFEKKRKKAPGDHQDDREA